jgi:hypothetical protein
MMPSIGLLKRSATASGLLRGVVRAEVLIGT